MKLKISQILGILIILAGYIYIGVRCAALSNKSFFLILALILYIYIPLTLHIILHEGGHLIAGLITGYKFISFRVGTLTLIQGKDNKLHLKKMQIKGTAGQCLMCPPKIDVKNCPYKLFHLSGGLINIILGIISLLIYFFLLPKNIITFALFEQFGIIGISIGLNNLIPSKITGMPNDGYNLIDLGKNIAAKKCQNIILEMNALLTMADSYQDLPKDLISEIKSIDFTTMDLSNSSIANAYMYQAAIYFSEFNYDKIYEIEKNMLNNPKLLEVFKNEAKCECLFYEITHGQSKEEIDKLYDKQLQQYVKATISYPSRQRLLYVYYHIYLKDEKKANEMYNKLEKTATTYVIKADANLELAVATSFKQVSIK